MRWYWFEHVTAERDQMAMDEFESVRQWPLDPPLIDQERRLALEERELAAWYATLDPTEDIPF